MKGGEEMEKKDYVAIRWNALTVAWDYAHALLVKRNSLMERWDIVALADTFAKYILEGKEVE